MSKILAIDPGPEQSAWLVYDTDKQKIHFADMDNNLHIKLSLRNRIKGIDIVVCEWMESFGMPVGKSIFETVFWIGQFAGSWAGMFVKLTRRQVKMHFCNSMRAKDSNIRQVLIDRFGGKEKAIGKKKVPGPLYCIKSHLWSALALAVYWAETQNSIERIDNGNK